MAKKHFKGTSADICGPPLECFVIAKITSQSKTMLGSYISKSAAKADLANQKAKHGAGQKTRYLVITRDEFDSIDLPRKTVAPELEKLGLKELSFPKGPEVIEGIRYGVKRNAAVVEESRTCNPAAEGCWYIVGYKAKIVNGKKVPYGKPVFANRASEENAKRIAAKFNLSSGLYYEVQTFDEYNEMRTRIKEDPPDLELLECNAARNDYSKVSALAADVIEELHEVAKECNIDTKDYSGLISVAKKMPRASIDLDLKECKQNTKLAKEFTKSAVSEMKRMSISVSKESCKPQTTKTLRLRTDTIINAHDEIKARHKSSPRNKACPEKGK